MPIKKSAMFFIALAVSSVSLLAFSSNTSIPVVNPAKCCKQLTETELFSPWGIISQSMLRTNV